MTLRELQKISDAVFPALLLDSLFSHETRLKIRKIAFYILVVTFVISFATFFENVISLVPGLQFIIDYTFTFRGIFFMVFVVWVVFHLYELLYFSYYFKNGEMDFEVAKIISKTSPDDITGGFLQSSLGMYTMKRLGLTTSVVLRFIETRKDLVTADEYEIIHTKKGEQITLAEYGRTLIHFDIEFAQMLSKYGITPDMFIETLRWVARTIRKVRRREMWWSRENLTRIPTLGKNWSFGRIPLLQRYGHSIFLDEAYITLGDAWRAYDRYVERLEAVLIKDSGANVMLVVDDTASGLDIAASLGKLSVDGKIHPLLEDKRLFVFDPKLLLEEMSTRSAFEERLQTMLAEVAAAGNVIVIIPHMDTFLEEAHSMSVDVSALLADALRSMSLQIIGLTSQTGFSATVEPHRDLMSSFTVVTVDSVDAAKVSELIEDEIYRLESLYGVFITYPAISEIISGAEKFYADEPVATKSFALLYEVVPQAERAGQKTLTRAFVQEFFEETTGVAQGPLSKDEQKSLQKLEQVLHERVIGQDQAVTAVAASLRRARAGLTNPKRPMGSFLFLGPTGVGKTETAKALTATLFGDEEDMVRIDMTEFQDGSALKRLIGSAQEPGVLTLKVREKPYGVLLLDEFEKAATDVHDLFLQILDEGFFTTGTNEKIHLRNMVIIATSNAGSREIIKMMDGATTLPETAKDTLIDILISTQAFKPELINRFDSVTVFSPLSEDNLKQIAELMIKKLNTRMAHKGIVIETNDALLEYLVKVGGDAKFGARAMNRAIQDTVERLIADGIIGGVITHGDTLVFSNDEGQLHVTKSEESV